MSEIMNMQKNNPFIDSIELPRREMTLIFLLDTSGSMAGSRIGSLNAALEETLPELKEISENNADAKIKIALMTFDTNISWLTPNGPVDVDAFSWTRDLEASGVTSLGEACLELNKQLAKVEKGGFMKAASGSFAPVIFLLSDGTPTDDFQRGIETLRKNNWFKTAIKMALAIGDDADMEVLAEFTGNAESVFKANNREQLKYLVKKVAVTSSSIASTSSNISAFGTGTETGDDIDVNDVSSAGKQMAVINAINVAAEEAPDDGSIEW